ncbi:MAG: ATP-binding cassette domain-containing protein, partial [Pseudomonadota bacterium]
MTDAVLEVDALDVRYGQVHAVRAVSLSVTRGGVTALLGANGAGKTSTVMAVAGARSIASGMVRIFGQDMTGAPPEDIVRAGVAISAEGRRIFASLSVEENLKVAGAVVAEPAVEAER